jgi:hypothetical protein
VREFADYMNTGSEIARLVEMQQVINALINLRHDALMLKMGAKLGGAIDARPSREIARDGTRTKP